MIGCLLLLKVETEGLEREKFKYLDMVVLRFCAAMSK